MEVRKQPDQKDFLEQTRKIHWVSDNPCGTSWIWFPWWPSHSVPWAWGRELCPSGQIKQKGLWRCWAESLRSLDIGGASGDAVKAHTFMQRKARPRPGQEDSLPAVGFPPSRHMRTSLHVFWRQTENSETVACWPARLGLQFFGFSKVLDLSANPSVVSQESISPEIKSK